MSRNGNGGGTVQRVGVGGTALALNIVVAYYIGQADPEMPVEVIAAAASLITTSLGWIGAHILSRTS